MDKKELKKLKKEKKMHEKALKKFHKKLGIPKESEDYLNHFVIKFIKEGGSLDEVVLTEDQMKNAVFMIDLYKANPEAMDKFPIPEEERNHRSYMLIVYEHFPKAALKFLPGEELQKDVNFMLNYAATVTIATGKDPFSTDNGHSGTLHVYRYVMEDMKFIDEIAEKYPEIDMKKITQDVFRSICSKEGYNKDNSKKQIEIEEKILEHFPKEYWIANAKKFGYSYFFSSLPADQRKELLEASIEYNGFETLKWYVSKDSLLDNKDLILKAAKKEGPEALKEFLLDYLDPHERVHIGYEGPGDPYISPGTYTHVLNEKMKEIQEKLLNDPEIIDALKVEKEMTDEKSDKEVEEDTKEEPVVSEEKVEMSENEKYWRKKADEYGLDYDSLDKRESRAMIKRAASEDGFVAIDHLADEELFSEALVAATEKEGEKGPEKLYEILFERLEPKNPEDYGFDKKEHIQNMLRYNPIVIEALQGGMPKKSPTEEKFDKPADKETSTPVKDEKIVESKLNKKAKTKGFLKEDKHVFTVSKENPINKKDKKNKKENSFDPESLRSERNDDDDNSIDDGNGFRR